MKTRHLAALAVAASLLLAVSGCAPTQSKAAACTSVLKTVDEATSSINGALPNFSSDPTGSAAVLEKAAASFHKGIATVTHPDISTVAKSADAAVASFSKDVRAAAADPTSADFTQLGTSSQAVSGAFVDIRRACD